MVLLTLAVGDSSPVVDEDKLLLPGQWFDREFSVEVLLLLFCRFGFIPGDLSDNSGHLRDCRGRERHPHYYITFERHMQCLCTHKLGRLFAVPRLDPQTLVVQMIGNVRVV